jgi:hypothetical protein
MVLMKERQLDVITLQRSVVIHGVSLKPIEKYNRNRLAKIARKT